MPRYLRIISSSLMSVALWGCGGGEEVKPVAGAGGVNQAGGAAGVDMPGAGAAAGAPAMQMPAAAPAAGAAADAKPSAASGARSAQDLLQFVPEDLQIAAGANFTVLSDSATPYSAQLLEQFKPVLMLLEHAGIKVAQVEQLWTGASRDKGELVTCVRTKSNYDASSITKALGAAGKTDKIGHASVHSFPGPGEINNVVAYVDGKTLLIGRLSTVTAALNNPKPGAIRFGLEAMAQPQAYYWIAGDDGSSQRLNIRGFEGTEWLVEGSPKPRGMAKCLAKATADGQGTPGGPGSMPGMPGGAGGMPAGGAAPTAGHGAKSFRAFQGAGAGGPAGGHGAGGGGMPPGGTMPPGGMMPGGQGGAGGVSKPVEISVGWSFDSEAAATQVEATLLDVIKAIQAAQQPQRGGTPGGMPPGGMPPGGMPPGGANPAAGHKAPMLRPFLQAGKAAGDPAQGHAPPGGPAGGMPGAGPMPGSSPGSDNDPNLTLVYITRDKANVKLRYNVTLDDTSTVGKLVAKAIEASGASAISDGLFDGTLTLLNTAIQKWEQEKPDQLIGTQKLPNLSIRGGYSWMTQLLPYVGHADLYATINFKKTWGDKDNVKAAFAVIPAFLNPADPRATFDGFPYAGMGLSHFAGMSGIENGRNEVAAELPRSDPRAGIFGYDRIAKPEEITDGASQTIMIVGTGEVAAPWIHGGGATIRGARQPYFDRYTGLGSKGLPKPGTFVLFADGSARLISADIDPEVFRAMCTMHGAEQIDMNKIAGGP